MTAYDNIRLKMVMMMTYYKVMIKVNVFAVKAKLSEYLDRVERGEQIIICRRNRPVAELRPLAATRIEPRPIGGLEDKIEILPSFFDPLPDEVLDSFYGGAVFPAATRAAESRPPYSVTKPADKRRGSHSGRRR